MIIGDLVFFFFFVAINDTKKNGVKLLQKLACKKEICRVIYYDKACRNHSVGNVGFYWTFSHNAGQITPLVFEGN